MEQQTFRAPNVLDGSTQDVEEFFSLIKGAARVDQYIFDMSAVRFVKPCGVIALVIATRYLSHLSDQRVCLKNIPDEVHSYLHRMNLFEIGQDWLQPGDAPDEEWYRNPQTPNLLELTRITGPEDVEAVASRAERIFSHWLMVSNLGDLLNVLSELCANIYQHSGDRHGCVLIQKYKSFMGDRAIVNVAVGDLGCGIRGSLVSRHGEIGEEPLDYLREAMQGRTARQTGRGGLGLRRVEQIAASRGGYLWLRSENAAILSRGPDKVEERSNLVFVPGTQVAVELQAPLRI
jgi:anti-sigma regulatory factor (Ser/Thr protein kinase)